MSNNKPSEKRQLAVNKPKELAPAISEISGVKAQPGLDQRIREISLNGNFTIGEDDWPDYTVLNSDNPFTVLFLDTESFAEYSDETVINHHREIANFLSSLRDRHDQGLFYHEQYPDLSIDSARRKIDQARDQLSSSEKRKSAYNTLIAKRKSEGKSILDAYLAMCLSDNRLTINESKLFIAEAEKWKYSPSEAAEILYKAITEKNYRVEADVDVNASILDKILTSNWSSIESVERMPHVFRLMFNDKVITTLEDLGKYFYDNKNLALPLIRSGRVVESITPYYPLVAENCANIIKRYEDEEVRYLGIIYELNPNLPFRVHSGVEISTESDLIELVFKSKEDLIAIVLRSFNNNHLKLWWRLKNDKIFDLFNSTHEGMRNIQIDTVSTKNLSKQQSKNGVPAVSREVFLAVLYKIKAGLPYFYNAELKFTHVNDFARWLVDNPAAGEEVQRQFNSGLVVVWLESCGDLTLSILARIQKLRRDNKLYPGNICRILGYALNPKLKFIVNNFTELDRIEDIALVLEKNNQMWSDFESLLSDRTLYYWLKFRGEDTLLESYEAKCVSLANRGLLDGNTALEALMDLACPKRRFSYSVTPPSGNIGSLASGSKKTLRFKVVKHGVGHLRVDLHVKLLSESKKKLVQPKVSPKAITIPVDETQKEFTVDISNNSELGITVRYHIALISNTSDTSIPVSYQSKLPVWSLLFSGIGGATLVGLLFVLMRLLMTWVTGDFLVTEFEEPSFGFKWVTNIAAYEWKLFAGFTGFVIVVLAVVLYGSFLSDEGDNVKQ